MKGEKEFFRKRFFGGFNREDVIKYIAKMADERNEALAAQEKAESKAQELAEELKNLREGTDKSIAEQPVVIEQAVEEPVFDSALEAVEEEPVVETVEEPAAPPVAEPVTPPQAYTLPPLEPIKKPAPQSPQTLPPLAPINMPAQPVTHTLPPLEPIAEPVAPVIQETPPAPQPVVERKAKTARLKVPKHR